MDLYRPDSQRGFAIIIALVLMAFVLLVMMSLSTLIRVDLFASATKQNQETARQNALLGLYVALGELQKHTGIDQITTGTAALYDADPSSAQTEDIAQAYWTGVWDKNGELQTWLVSGNAGLDTDNSAFARPDSAPVNGIDIRDSGTVRVPFVPVGDEGGYAYWIEDEGVKAKVNLRHAAQVDDPLVSAQKINIAKIEDLGDWETVPANLQARLLGLADLNLIAPNDTVRQALANRAHDLTTESLGLLTDPVNGGLKRDLTLALFDDSDLPTGQIFPPEGGTVTNADPGGPKWLQLQDWVNVSGTTGLPVRQSTDEQAGIFPVVTQVQYYVVIRHGAAPDYFIYADILPAVTLWNPYDHALESTDYRIDIGTLLRAHEEATVRNQYDQALFPWNISTTTSGGWTAILLSTDLQKATLSFTLPGVTLAAGETMVFSPPAGNQPLDVFKLSDKPVAGQNRLEPGFRQEASYYVNTGRKLQGPAYDNPAPNFQLRAALGATTGFRLARLDTGETLTDVAGLPASSTYVASQTAMEPLLDSSGSAQPITDLSGGVGRKIMINFVETAADPSVQWLANGNPRAAFHYSIPYFFHGVDDDVANTSQINNPSYLSRIEVDGNDQTIGLPISGSEAGTGYSVNPSYVKKAVLFEAAPVRERLHSIGQLMHAPLYFANEPSGSESVKLSARMRWVRADNLLPAYAIGSGKASPYIPLVQTSVNWGDFPPSGSSSATFFRSGGLLYDYPYLLNNGLWDRYFFSALPAAESRTSANRRLLALDASATDALASAEVAAHFLVDGAFNVNSTSESAWRALLAAFFKEPVNGSAAVGSSFPRSLVKPGAFYDASSDSHLSDQAYSGYRSLSDAQIANLARQIVKQVKYRGPFTSLAQFVNRNPEQDAPAALGVDAFRLRGALDAALLAADALSQAEADELKVSLADARINTSLQVGAAKTTPRTETGFMAEAQEGWRTEAIPGWLTQADLLARLGAGLTSRSDTFRIHVYGSALDPHTGETVSTAHIVATVQRMPDFIDPAGDAAATPWQSLSSERNQTIGRRYRIVHFHWE